MEEKVYDVLVVGAGPAGSVAAKRCAEQGLRTLMVEKRKLPRDKVCSGLIMGRLAKMVIEKEFGQLPREIPLATLSGLILWVPKAGQRKVGVDIPITWRRDLDYWMNRKANEKGVEIWDGTSLKRMSTNGRISRIIVQKAGVEAELEARFVIGADGIKSITRQFLFPELEATYSTAYRECYKGTMNMEKGYAYIVFTGQGYRPRFWILPKGDCFTLEGPVRPLKGEIRTILAPWGFSNQKPLWKDGCLSRVQFPGHLFPSTFTSARNNVLLTGDAAGLQIPVSGEGIGTALKSGVLAANAIVESLRTGKEVSKIYTGELSPLLATLRSDYLKLEQIKSEANRGPEALLDALATAFEESLEY